MTCFSEPGRKVLSRRALLGAGAGAMLAASLPGRLGAVPGPLAARTAWLLVDAEDGTVLAAQRPDALMPPASVAKVPTALYALHALGARYRFRTRVIATAPLKNGVLDGDLVLAGGGDPVLDTDALGDMVAMLAAEGLRTVRGRFVVVADALPEIARVAEDQPEHEGYNPAIAGLNLNFNRVRLDWSPGLDGPDFAFVAGGERYQVPVAGIGGALGAARPARHRIEDGREIWTLPRQELRGRGSVWLPVRDPVSYAAEVFRGLAAQAGIALPGAERGLEVPPGVVLAEAESPHLENLIGGMLRFSTNLTAEVLGLAASRARGAPAETLADSAGAMRDWLAEAYGIDGAAFENHSGLSTRTVISPEETVGMLVAARGRLPGLLRDIPIRGAGGAPFDARGVRVVAKTGTIHFGSGLAGYVLGNDGRRLAFAIFSADLDRRAGFDPQGAEPPAGSGPWARGARDLQQDLLRDWALRHAGMTAPVLRPLPRG